MGADIENKSAGNVLSFAEGAARRAERLPGAAAELQALLAIYEQMIALLRETDDAGLDILTDAMVVSLVRARGTLQDGCDEASCRDMVKELRAGLRETPRTLRSLLPGLGPRLGESIEHKLGIQFAKY